MNSRTAVAFLAAVSMFMPVPLSAQSRPGGLDSERALNVAAGASAVRPVAASPLGRHVSLDVRDLSIEATLKLLEEQAEVRISYSRDIVPVDRLVTVKLPRATLGKALSATLRGLDVRILAGPNDQVVIARSAGVPPLPLPVVARQTGSISGRVVSAQTGEGLQGASVLVDQDGLGTVTGGGGRYRIQGIAPGPRVVRAVLIGYTEAERHVVVAVGENIIADFALEPEAIALDAIVVTGTVVATRVRELPSPITNITADQIRQLNISRVDQLFRGTVPGAMAFDLGPYNYFSAVQMRGQNSLNFGFIKTYIDGVEISEPVMIATIDPNSIERIEILRGPQASTIYGSDASGGVMQIFTKKGQRSARPVLNVKTSVGLIESRYAESDGVLQNDHSLSLSGGGEDFSYNLGGSFFSEGQYVPEGETRNYSAFGGMRASHGALSAELTGRYYIKDFAWPMNPILQATGYAPFQSPAYEQDYVRQQTVGLNLGYLVSERWHHQLVLGYDRNLFQYYNWRARLRTPADTLHNVSFIPQDKTSIRYNNSVLVAIADGLSATLTTGVDHYTYTQAGFFTTEAGAPFGIIDASSITATHDVWDNTGYFAQAKLGIADRLFLTGGLRLEKNDNFGDDRNDVVAPRVGAAYSFSFGGADVKTRASWGRALKPPLPQHRGGFVYGPFQVLANPDIGPEEQAGWDSGLEVYFGRRGHAAVTYYDQKAINLIDNVIDFERLELMFQNVGEIRNRGWELEGQLNVEPFSFRSTVTTMNSTMEKLSPTYMGALQVGDALLEIPDYSIGATGAYAFGRGTVSVSLTHMGPWTGTDWIELYGVYYGGQPYRGSDRDYWMRYDAFTKWNLAGNYALSESLQAFATVANLTNLQTVERDNTSITAGRTTAIGFRYTH
jgi:outer membrane receptor protein involved in Fe transport